MSRGSWTEALARLGRDRLALLALVLLGLLAGTAALAPLLANDEPIIASLDGELCFPAWHDYLEVVVPWASAREGLEAWQLGDHRPLSPYYAQLHGQSWNQARDEGRLSWALWPPVPWDYDTPDPAVDTVAGASPGHPLGTAEHGYDVLARLIHGAVVAAQVGGVAMGIATSIGLLLGLVAGSVGGWVDELLSRLTEVVMVFPTFFLIIAVMAFLEPSVVNIMAVLGLVGWTGIFRLVRGEVLTVRSRTFVEAARALGIPWWRIAWRHVLPHALSPVFVAVAFGVASAILAEAALSFLGLSDLSTPSWGALVNQGRIYMDQGGAHLILYPGIVLFLTLTALNLFGQSLRDALDPKGQ